MDNKIECYICGWKGMESECIDKEVLRKYGDGRKELTLELYCPKCNGIVTDYQVISEAAELHGDNDPEHAQWGSDDYGEYGGE